MRDLLLLVFIIAVSANTLRFDRLKPELDGEWKEYKISFKKNYPSQVDETIRRVQWEKNLQHIQKHNVEADLGRYSYYLGLNEYADLSNAEYRQFLLCSNGNKTVESGSTFLPPSNVQMPGTVDWRTKGYVTQVKNQGQCGSCWSFSATGSLEGQHFKKTGKLVSLSEQNLMDCSVKFGNLGCLGGFMDKAFRYVIANKGIDTEASYPYEAKDYDRCRFKRADVGATCTGYVDITKFSESDLQTAVATIGPVSVAIDADHSSFRFYSHGVYDEPDCRNLTLNHGVLAVGYGTSNDKDYWLVKNSWGTSWGMKGYVMMSRNKNNQCGIASLASYPTV